MMIGLKDKFICLTGLKQQTLWSKTSVGEHDPRSIVDNRGVL